jgi:hypothetical protein
VRLNGWQRIGIIASVIWAIGGGFWGNELGIEQGDWVVDALKVCMDVHPDDWPKCNQEFAKEYPEAIKYHWVNAAIFAFVPIVLGWLVAWGAVATVRWVRRGFAEPH